MFRSKTNDIARSWCLSLVYYLLLLTAYYFTAGTEVYASELFSGLVVSQGEQGVKVVEIYPGCPAERAGLMVGDLILEVDGQKVKTLEGFVDISRTMGDKSTEADILFIRKGKLQKLHVITYSDIVFKEWKEKVPPPPASNIRGLSLFQYYMERGKAKLEANKQGGSFESKLARGEEAIRCFFYALHYSPAEVGVALLIADTYIDMAKLCQENGQTPQAIENYGKAAGLYEKSSKKHVTEKELELILARLQEVEKELLGLLPPEEQASVSAEKTSAGSLSGNTSP